MRRLFNGIFLVPFFILGFLAQAQVNSVSPYSKLGLGDFQSDNYTRGLSMGGANLALPDAFNINNTNPASYSNLELSTFEAGFRFSFIRQEQANPDIRIENANAGLNYFSFGTELTDWWGSAVGIQPYSAQGYNISADRMGPDNIAVTDSFYGSGGINKVYWGNAFDIAEGLSLGFNASFLFGSLSEENYLLWDAGVNDVVIEQEVHTRGLRLDYGLQYSYSFKNESELGVGLTFANKSRLAADVERYSVLIGTNGLALDSLSNSGSSEADITLPGEMGIGLFYGKKNNGSVNHAWAISADIHWYQGSEFENYDGSTELINAYRAELGGNMVPALAFENLERTGNYLGQIEYRLGGFYQKTPYSINGRQLSDYGITFGFGLPVRQRNLAPAEVKRSLVSAGVILGRRGSLANGLIRESYAHIYLGITLNDKWFIKYKYR